MGSSRRWVVVLALVALVALGMVSCTSGGNDGDPTPIRSGAAPRPVVLEIREVLGEGTALNGMPFTTGVLEPDDPYRDDPAFAEAPPDASGDLVTFEDDDGDGFYTAGSDQKLFLGPADITDHVRHATAVLPTVPEGTAEPAWEVDFRYDATGKRILARLSRRLLGKRLAIVLDRIVASAPTVQGIITSGQAQIAGNFTEQQARDIAAGITAP